MIEKNKKQKNNKMKRILFLLLIISSTQVFGQLENPKIRQGNKFFAQKRYSLSEAKYQKAKKINPNSTIADFNYATAQYKQKNYKSALANYQRLSKKVKSKDTLASVLYNTGNTYVRLAEDTLKKKSLQGAIDNLESSLKAYKSSIKLNPSDKEAKFNYVIAKKILDKLKKQQKKQNKNKNKNNKNKNKKQQKNKNNKDKKKNQQNKNNKNKQDKGKNQKPKKMNQKKNEKKYSIPYNEMMRLLNAVEKGDQKTYKKVNAKLQKNVKSKIKNW